MAIYHNGKSLDAFYHDGKKINTIYHDGKKIYQWYLPSNSVLWQGNVAFSSNHYDGYGGGDLVTTSEPIELSGKLSNIKNGLIFNFGGGVYCDTDDMWKDQQDTSTKIPKSNITNKNIVVNGIGLWSNDSVYAQMIDETHVSFTSTNIYGGSRGPMSTCIGWVNGNNNVNNPGKDGYYFSICKSIIAY